MLGETDIYQITRQANTYLYEEMRTLGGMHTAVDGLLTTILGVGGALGGNDEVQGLERWVKITREMQGARTSILSITPSAMVFGESPSGGDLV